MIQSYSWIHINDEIIEQQVGYVDLGNSHNEALRNGRRHNQIKYI